MKYKCYISMYSGSSSGDKKITEKIFFLAKYYRFTPAQKKSSIWTKSD